MRVIRWIIVKGEQSRVFDDTFSREFKKNMFNLDEEKIEFALGNRAFFWQGKKEISYVEIGGIYFL